MSSRTFDLAISVPLENRQAGEAATAAIIETAKQMYALLAMLAWMGEPRITLSYTTINGLVEVQILGEQPREQSNDKLSDLTR